MQIPTWLFLSSLLLALTWQDMASLVFRRAFPPFSFSNSIRSSLPLSISRNIPSLLQHPSLNQQQNTRHFSQTEANMASKSAQFLDFIKTRRTIYTLKKESTISDAKIQEIVKEALLHTPSSFNSQTTRILILLKDDHHKLWDFTKEAIKAIVPADQWPASEQRLNGFQGAYGSILFFESRSGVKKMQDNFALYADKFPGWATQSNAMTQLAIWTALELEGLGANLQHYNPLIDAKVQAEWKVPEDWVLNAQLVFGTPTAPAGNKEFAPIEDRVKVFGA